MPSRNGGTVVLTINTGRSGALSQHEIESRRAMAERIAGLLGFRFDGGLLPGESCEKPLYVVPTDTLLASEAKALAIAGPADLFGGVVPATFASTKSITHPLVDAQARAPVAWRPEVAAAMSEAVLKGYSVFDTAAARRAATRMLQRGPVRVKKGLGVGGQGQGVFNNVTDLEQFVGTIPEQDLLRFGAVLEENLEEVTTFSIGQVNVGNATVSYYGTQEVTSDHDGQMVYGGSKLHVQRGGLGALLDTVRDPLQRRLVAQALRYEAAALNNLPGLFASRRNYDVALGIDAEGRQRSGVLEQSWRIGGATPAEILALEVLKENADMDSVDVVCRERHEKIQVPRKARVHFHGTDDGGRPLIKYAEVL